MTTNGVNNNGFVHDDGKRFVLLRFTNFFFSLSLYVILTKLTYPCSYSPSKGTNFEKVERMSFGTKDKTADGHLTDDYDPYEHRQIVHPIS